MLRISFFYKLWGLREFSEIHPNIFPQVQHEKSVPKLSLLHSHRVRYFHPLKCGFYKRNRNVKQTICLTKYTLCLSQVALRLRSKCLFGMLSEGRALRRREQVWHVPGSISFTKNKFIIFLSLGLQSVFIACTSVSFINHFLKFLGLLMGKVRFRCRDMVKIKFLD